LSVEGTEHQQGRGWDRSCLLCAVRRPLGHPRAAGAGVYFCPAHTERWRQELRRKPCVSGALTPLGLAAVSARDAAARSAVPAQGPLPPRAAPGKAEGGAAGVAFFGFGFSAL